MGVHNCDLQDVGQGGAFLVEADVKGRGKVINFKTPTYST